MIYELILRKIAIDWLTAWVIRWVILIDLLIVSRLRLIS